MGRSSLLALSSGQMRAQPLPDGITHIVAPVCCCHTPAFHTLPTHSNLSPTHFFDDISLRAEHFMKRLLKLAEISDVLYPPLAERIKTAIEVIVVGLMVDTAPCEMDLQARQVIIQYAETVNVYSYSAGAAEPLQDTPQSGG